MALHSALVKYGEEIVLKRPFTKPDRTLGFIEVTCFARVVDSETTELVGNVAQRKLEIIISNEEIVQNNWPGPPKKGDSVVVRGRTAAIDDQPLSLTQGSEYARHEIFVKGV